MQMANEDVVRRGFATIATGSEHYYQLAANLLHSYRRNGGGAWPFAIIAEEENEYTKAFDQLVLMPNPTHSYMDKLRLFECLPYDEIIFIDADCLVYGCIDDWWSRFENGPAFSCFGSEKTQQISRIFTRRSRQRRGYLSSSAAEE